MSNSRIEDKLLKDVSYRKKPKQLYSNKSNTWSSPSVKHQLNNPSNKLDITDFSSNNNQILPIEERIKIYEAKYMQCLNSKTQLLVWIKSTKEKGPPKPLTEGIFQLYLKLNTYSNIMYSRPLYTTSEVETTRFLFFIFIDQT
jgi:trans-aconitate methyltransferase